MPRHFRAACIQVSAGEDFQKNLTRIDALVFQALKKKPRIVALPENFSWRGASAHLPDAAARTSSVIRHFAGIAKKHKTAFLLGSLIERSSVPGKYYNTSFLISEKGVVAARYRKIHLFKIQMPHVKTDESRHIVSGNKLSLADVFGVTAGLSICYDLRFPELFRSLTLRGARILFVPANFTEATGKAHWEVLLRARAIENQAFVMAPAQTGISPSSQIKSFGSSLIIDPWGRVLARGSQTKDQIIFADLDFQGQRVLRKAFPVLDPGVLRGAKLRVSPNLFI